MASSELSEKFEDAEIEQVPSPKPKHSHVAPIKSEFLLKSETCSKTDIDNNNQTENIENPNSPPAKRPKKQRGMNKKRPRENYSANPIKFCNTFLTGQQKCQFGDECRFSHDKQAFLDSKLPDLDGKCPIFDIRGSCRFGLMCRFYGSHPVEGENLLENPKIDNNNDDVLNRISLDQRTLLEKRKMSFQKSEEYLRKIRDEKTQEKNYNQCEVTEKEPRKPKRIKQEDWRGKLFLAPLTTVGNLPFRRICVDFGAEITCGEMALATEILRGNKNECALLRRHSSEKFFGIQLCGAHPDTMTKCAEFLTQFSEVDFIDINSGCPIDLICHKGAGCSLMNKSNKLREIIQGISSVIDDRPLTLKMRTGFSQNKNTAHFLLPKLANWGVDLCTIHGRSREQRYSKLADWSYIEECAKICAPNLPLYGCGDILSFEDYYEKLEAQNADNSLSGVMIARGALIKPWIFTEIKERRNWDISSSERLDILKNYVKFGLDHWGSDQRGVETTRRFLLEWLSFLHRYIPVGLLERLPQKINDRPPNYQGRDQLETLMASPNCSDWVKLSEMLLGAVGEDFQFLPKHKANAYLNG